VGKWSGHRQRCKLSTSQAWVCNCLKVNDISGFLKSICVSGQPLKVVMLGGSVAVGMGVVDRNNSFASLLAKWFHSFNPIAGENVEVGLLVTTKCNF
jgi:hypothetical protein